MSQYLVVSMVCKKDPKISLTLLDYSTSLARELSSEDIFPYTDTEKVLSIEKVNEYINDLNTKKKEYQEFMNVYKERLSSYQSLLTKCQTKESMDRLFEEINNCECIAKSYNEDVDNYDSIIKDVENIKKVYELNLPLYGDNKEPMWDLVYTNC